MRVCYVSFNKLRLPELYFRYSIDWNHVRRLADSIAKHGLLEPLLVRKLNDNEYEVLDGVHRYYALKILHISKVKVRITDMNYIQAYKFILSTAENKNKFSIIDRMYAIVQLAKHYRKSIHEIAKELGISAKTVERYLLVWQYSTEEEKELLAQGKISFRKLLQRCIQRKRNTPTIITCQFCNANVNHLRSFRVCSHCYTILKQVSNLIQQLPDTNTVERRLAMFVSLVQDMVKSNLLEREYEDMFNTVYQILLLLCSVRDEVVEVYSNT